LSRHGLPRPCPISGGDGQGSGSATSYDNTLLTATDTLTMNSGRDTNLAGAQAGGERVNMNVGGNPLARQAGK
jgi:filamentous hemagglutinin